MNHFFKGYCPNAFTEGEATEFTQEHLSNLITSLSKDVKEPEALVFMPDNGTILVLKIPVSVIKTARYLSDIESKQKEYLNCDIKVKDI